MNQATRVATRVASRGRRRPWRPLAVAALAALASTIGPTIAATPTPAIATLFAVREAAAATVDYLYVESNEGSSSGGHVALRVGDRVFDFQHHEPGVVRLGRRDANDFLHAYAWLQNRPVHATRLDVTDEAFESLREHLQARYLEESARFAALEVLRDDARLLADLAAAARHGGPVEVRVPGAGFFVAATTGGEAASPALVRLREAAGRRFGSGWLRDRLAAEQAALAALEPSVLDAADLGGADGAWPRVDAAFSRRCRDRLAAVAALEVLRDAGSLAPGALVVADDETPPLDSDERAALASFAGRLEDDLVELLASRRGDWGPVFLVGMARLAAVEQSLASGRLVVVDVFAAAPRVLPRHVVDGAGVADEVARDAAADVAAARTGFVSASRPGGAPAERDYADLEAATARRGEWIASARERRDVRLLDDESIPTREAVVPWSSAALSNAAPSNAALPNTALASPAPSNDAVRAGAGDRAATSDTATSDTTTSDTTTSDTTTSDTATSDTTTRDSSLDAMALRAERLARRHEAALQGSHEYDLVRRNCVSELFRTVDGAFGGDRAVAARALGMAMPGDGADSVVPFLSAATVARSPSVSATRVFPSLRERRLAALDARDDAGMAARLREAWVPTATTYRRHPDDSSFLLFADWAPARPLAGAVNLAAGAVATVAGALAAPFAGWGPATSGLRGMVYSLPELAFVRIRRGSFVHAPRPELELPEGW